MADDTIKIAIEAVDNASATFEKVGDEVDRLGKSFEGVGLASEAVDKKLSEYGAAIDDVTRKQNQLKAAQLDAQEAANRLAQAQKALSENTDPSKMAELDRELVNAQVQLDKAGQEVQSLSKNLRDSKGAADDAKGGFSNLQAAIITVNQGIDLVGRGISVAKQVIDQTIGSTVAYAKEVRDLSTNLGISAEETSKIIQASDDYGISVGEVTAALQMAVKKGFAPNIETLAKLADEYNNINDPTERAARLTEVFGRNWTALTPMLKEGGAAIRGAAAEAEKLGLVLSEADTKAARELEVQIDNLNDRVEALKLKLGKEFVPAAAESVDILTKFTDIVIGSEAPLDRMIREREYLIQITGKESEWTKRATDAIDEYSKELSNIADQERERTRLLEAAARESGVLVTSIDDLNQGVRNQADTYAVLDVAMDKTISKSNLLAASQKIVTSEMTNLKTAMAGALQNELTNFGKSQDDLADKAAKVKEELDKLQATQGRVVTTTSKHALSANEAKLAQLELAKAENELNTETAKGNLTAEQQVALQEKIALNQGKLEGVTKSQIKGSRELTAAQEALKSAQAELNNNTDPMKQAKLAVEVDKLKEKLGQAAGAVNTYVDNSKRIKELQGQYDEINKEIEANVAAHEKATKTILFGYAEQQLAVDGFTETEAKALDALAVKWGLKSQEDITAMQNIRTAAANLAKDGSIEEFANTVGANLDKVNSDYEKTQGKITETSSVTNALTKVGVIPPIEIPIAPKSDQADKSAFLATAQGYVNNATLQVPLTPKTDTAAQDAFQRSAAGYITHPVEVPIAVKPGSEQDVRNAISKAGIPIDVTPKLAPGSKETVQKEARGYFPGGIEVPIKPKIDMADRTKLGHDLAGDVKFAPTITPKIDTTQAAKDIQAYTTDKVGGIPKEKTTKAIFDTVTATTNANAIIKLFNVIPKEKNTEINVDAKLALQTLDDVVRQIGNIYSKTIEIIVKYTQKGEVPPGFQHGADFIVPPSPTGTTGDYYPFMAAAGERVTVTPAAQQKQAAPIGGDTYNYTTNVYNPLAAAMLADKQRRDRLARSNSRMGVT